MSSISEAHNAPSWQLDGFSAWFTTPRMLGSCDLLAPGRGLCEVAIDGAPLANVNLLGLSLPAANRADLEAYTRRGDLVGIYSPTEAHPFRSQAYWRLASHDLGHGRSEAIAAIELVASKQTDLLDSSPELSVGSELPCVTAWRLTDVESAAFDEIDLRRKPTFCRSSGVACFLFRLLGNALSYAEMVYPLDFETSTSDCVDRADQTVARTRHQLFAHRLEKGVILRSRVLGLVLPRENDMQSVQAHYRAFASSDPPLTT